MILYALAAAVAQPAIPVAPPAPPPPATAPDPARMAVAQQLLDIIKIERQYDQILGQLIPVMTVQVFGSLKDNVNVPTALRTYLADADNHANAVKIFAEEAAKAFKASYPRMRSATAAEYARVFSAEELTTLVDFYRTPLGQKALASMPDIQTKLMPIGMTAGMEAGQTAMARTIERIGIPGTTAPKS